MCGFNAHHQLVGPEHHSDEDILKFRRICQSPYLKVRCALWSCTIVENDGVLIHRGFRTSGLSSISIDGPPPRNIKTFFGDVSGMIGALTKDGSVLLFSDDPGQLNDSRLRKYRFDENSFLFQQNLIVEHLTIANNGEVCTCTSMLLILG